MCSKDAGQVDRAIQDIRADEPITSMAQHRSTQGGFHFRLISQFVFLVKCVHVFCRADGGVDRLQLRASVNQKPNTFHAFLCRKFQQFHLDYALLLYNIYALVCWNIDGVLWHVASMRLCPQITQENSIQRREVRVLSTQGLHICGKHPCPVCTFWKRGG